ncbi:Predicted dehydrogenase [Actinokineospora alba]|uniref:Predicted dehydrogenase n=1 Tax=Actinokineospora alba TaxID=504798 RepID=A0A1H0T1U0_9PSEU|nr:Gfo/Idh/MocA family oxidoreductase [Actinokineospora alba]TDP66427.1 putative dehydrogenase [Actinokineospora alba]SDJ24846.1 Predicted dehydrogenase [Actinokineospora alba]SDP47670.1 Predicted dehydrogenase [Actinokineospora alba]
MGDSVLRVGLVGAGPWATAVHAPGIAAHPSTELAAVWARRPEAAADLGAPVVADFDELLSTVDAVAFAVPPAIQAEMAIKAANAGKHVILEKPIADSVETAERLVDAVEKAGVASMVVFIRRFAPETIQWLDDVQGQTWAGGNARWLSGALLGGRYSGSAWRHAGGALIDVGPHVFDLLDAALGPVVEVVAAHHGAADLWTVVLGHESGATSTSTLSMFMPVDPTVTDVSVYGDGGYRELGGRASSAQDAYAALLDDFTGMVRDRRAEHPLNVHRGLMIQRLLAAVTKKL